MLVPVVKAEDLPSFGWNTGKSDPYVEIRIVSVDVRVAMPILMPFIEFKKNSKGFVNPHVNKLM